MAYETIIYEKDGGIATITLNRPHALNATNPRLKRELLAALQEAAEDDTVWVVVITGAGRAFCAGNDMKEGVSPHDPLAQIRKSIQLTQKVGRAIRDLPKPVIAAVNGYALGGGCELALSCDIILASSEARFGFPEVGLGFFINTGVTHALPRLVGPAKAKELVMTGDMVDGAEAARIGLANQVFPAAEFPQAVKSFAQKIASKAPVAISLAKTYLDAGAEGDARSALAFETEAVIAAFVTEDAKEGYRAFKEKRQAVFKGE